MRAPPLAHTATSGTFRSSAAAEECEIHDGEHEGGAADPRLADDDRLRLSGSMSGLPQPVRIVAEVDEGQWVGTAGREGGLAEAALVGQQLDARTSAQP
jgi:hypothetical protein